MKTLDQLNQMTDYELNCAVAEKLGLDVRNKTISGRYLSTNGTAVLCSPKGEIQVWKDYCNTPNDYMPIAIEHGIDIEFDVMSADGEKVVCCTWAAAGGETEDYPRAQTGRAVCIAFLMMQPPKEID